MLCKSADLGSTVKLHIKVEENWLHKIIFWYHHVLWCAPQHPHRHNNNRIFLKKETIHYPEPFHAFYLVPPHHSSCEVFWLLKRYRLSITFPNWVKKGFRILPNRLRQSIFNYTIWILIFLKIFYTEISSGRAFIL